MNPAFVINYIDKKIIVILSRYIIAKSESLANFYAKISYTYNIYASYLAPEYLAYQGCWIDDPLDRDLTQQVANIAGPSDCILACKTRGLMYAGVQMVSSCFMIIL